MERKKNGNSKVQLRERLRLTRVQVAVAKYFINPESGGSVTCETWDRRRRS